MRDKAWGNEYRSTTVCIDHYKNGILAGRFFNPYLEHGETFDSLTQFILKMDQTLDTMNFPQSYSKIRTFAEPPKRAGPTPGPAEPTGTLATFSIRILFRQNASWQGSILWREGGREQSFRSVLELIFLMDSVLSREQTEAS